MRSSEVAAAFLRLEKAENPLDPKGFVRIVDRLSRALAAATEGTEARALRKALDRLNVDWRGMSEAARDRVVDAARRALPAPARIAELTAPVWNRAGNLAERAFDRAARAVGAPSGVTFATAVGDPLVDAALTDMQALYVTNHLGTVQDAWSASARQIVAGGVSQGLDRHAIASALERRLGPAAELGRRRDYWDVISAAYANRARTFGQLSAFNEAGIQTFMFEAVLDEVTTDICTAMHGMEFQVQAALDRYKAVADADDPTAVRELQPWVRASKGELWIPGEGDERVTIARVERSAIGRQGQAGSYSGMLSAAALERLGVTVPPLHGRCRSTIIPGQ